MQGLFVLIFLCKIPSLTALLIRRTYFWLRDKISKIRSKRRKHQLLCNRNVEKFQGTRCGFLYESLHLTMFAASCEKRKSKAYILLSIRQVRVSIHRVYLFFSQYFSIIIAADVSITTPAIITISLVGIVPQLFITVCKKSILLFLYTQGLEKFSQISAKGNGCHTCVLPCCL